VTAWSSRRTAEGGSGRTAGGAVAAGFFREKENGNRGARADMVTVHRSAIEIQESGGSGSGADTICHSTPTAIFPNPTLNYSPGLKKKKKKKKKSAAWFTHAYQICKNFQLTLCGNFLFSQNYVNLTLLQIARCVPTQLTGGKPCYLYVHRRHLRGLVITHPDASISINVMCITNAEFGLHTTELR